MSEIRVDSTLLEANQGRVVRCIGRCESYNAPTYTATIISTGPVSLILDDEQKALEVGKIYEVIGKLSASDLTIKVYNVIDMSDNLNLDVAQKLAHFTHKVPELFYS